MLAPSHSTSCGRSFILRVSPFTMLAGLSIAAIEPGYSQSYPSSPVKVISDSAPGSAPDVILRIVADQLGQHWGQQIVVLNQPGAGGSLAARAAAGTAPDGYTFFMAVSSTFVTMKGAAPNIPVQVPNDFQPVSLVS